MIILQTIFKIEIWIKCHVSPYILAIKIQMVTKGNCTFVACATFLEYTNGLMKYESIPYILFAYILFHAITCCVQLVLCNYGV
jgi:hypothetical protein